MHGRSLIVNDTDTDSRFYAEISKSIGYPTYSILAVPMRVRDVTVGVIEILNKKQKKYFTQDDLRWLRDIRGPGGLGDRERPLPGEGAEEIHYLRDKVQAEQGWHNLIAKSPLIVEKLDLIARVAETESSVLILRRERRRQGAFRRAGGAAAVRLIGGGQAGVVTHKLL